MIAKYSIKFILPAIAAAMTLLLVFVPSKPVLGLTDAETRVGLEQELKDIEAQIADFASQLAAAKNQKKTLANKIAELKRQQNILRLKIQATAIRVNDLDKRIVSARSAIAQNENKIKLLRANITGMLRQINAKNQNMLVQFFSVSGLDGIFIEIRNYTRVSTALSRVVAETKMTKRRLETQKVVFGDQQEEAKHLLTIKLGEQQQLGGKLGEQADLLQETKGLESNYQAMLNESKKRAAAIKTRLYELLGVGKQINFGEALQIAKWVNGVNGIRPAFLLAILTQESSLGKNVGTCNRPGDPPEKSWRVVMKPERDQEPFQQITAEIGLNPDTTPVSCPMRRNGRQIGWGGAMGPAQFIPSTWMGYRNKVSAITGKSAANPWDIRDAFLAAGIKLKSNGADGTESGEWKAAMIYFSGSTNSQYRFYGDSVMAQAAKYQADIDEVNNQ